MLHAKYLPNPIRPTRIALRSSKCMPETQTSADSVPHKTKRISHCSNSQALALLCSRGKMKPTPFSKLLSDGPTHKNNSLP